MLQILKLEKAVNIVSRNVFTVARDIYFVTVKEVFIVTGKKKQNSNCS